ncbi:hypothetical protein PM10SUCC1_17400 [Propionigenium maris DSM 9537]|uniref:DUF1499 domain-containing protein n=1 Tax=Propionigenium maris DSM 9537 TaxID=1123000 RepID=A0A9W6GM38_9FUSO|nr:DUF1499 domain-containing protein [Propionigenium maris]GLI56226.1 hypothetical protein PM10SUCC1_17400 [Propionigenium maris DSM 9537]
MKSLVLLMFVVLFTGCSSVKKGPTFDGVSLGACPASPNCVSSLEEREGKHYLEEIGYRGSREEAVADILEAVKMEKNYEIVTEREDYIHVIFRSGFFKFIDDLELYLPEDERGIHFRSAARSGYSDFGVNRKRVERIRERFEARER